MLQVKDENVFPHYRRCLAQAFVWFLVHRLADRVPETYLGGTCEDRDGELDPGSACCGQPQIRLFGPLGCATCPKRVLAQSREEIMTATRPTPGGHNVAWFVPQRLADDSLTQSVYLWSDS